MGLPLVLVVRRSDRHRTPMPLDRLSGLGVGVGLRLEVIRSASIIDWGPMPALGWLDHMGQFVGKTSIASGCLPIGVGSGWA
jgi:hypothetical protein